MERVAPSSTTRQVEPPGDLCAVNDEVFVTREAIAKVGPAVLDFLKAKASVNPRRRARLCAHRRTDDAVHEMVIVHTKDTYVRPHRHPNKSESFHVIEGRLKVIVFDDAGGILDVVQLGPPGSGETFFYRLSESAFHTVLFLSDVVVFHETTVGPFRRGETIVAPWAPGDEDHEAQALYMKELAARAARAG